MTIESVPENAGGDSKEKARKRHRDGGERDRKHRDEIPDSRYIKMKREAAKERQ